MMNAKAKTPNKRKSLPNKFEAKKPKLEDEITGKNTPGKKNNQKQNGSPNKGQQQNKKAQQNNVQAVKPFEGTKKLNLVAKAEQKTKPQQNNKDDKKPKATQQSSKPQLDGKKKKKKGTFFHIEEKLAAGKKDDVIKELTEKIDTIQSRPELTKTAKKKLSILKSLRNRAEGKVKPAQPQAAKSSSQKRRDRKKKAAEKTEGEDTTKSTQKKKTLKKVVQAVAQESDDDDDDDEDDVEEESGEEDSDEVEGEDDNSDEAEEEEDDDDDEEDEDDESDDDDQMEAASDDDSSEEDESDAEEPSDNEDVEGDSESDDSDVSTDIKPLPTKLIQQPLQKKLKDVPQKQNIQQNKKQPKKTEQSFEKKTQDTAQKKKDTTADKPGGQKNVNMQDLKQGDFIKAGQKRFVVFVGNIPYDTTKQDLLEHFKSVGEVRHIRIPTEKKSDKPRGFAYVEVSNEESYQRCMSKHHSFLKGRRINVLYTQGGKKKGEEKKKEIKVKNFKLHAMRNEGQLAGSTKQSQKRSFRRAKQQKANKPQDD